MQRQLLTPCPKCGEDRVIVSLLTGGGVMTLVQFGRKGHFAGKNKSGLQVTTCTYCGYTEFYALKPGNLRPDD